MTMNIYIYKLTKGMLSTSLPRLKMEGGLFSKHPEYGRHSIPRAMRKVAPIPQ